MDSCSCSNGRTSEGRNLVVCFDGHDSHELPSRNSIVTELRLRILRSSRQLLWHKSGVGTTYSKQLGMFHKVLHPFNLAVPQTFDEGVIKGYKWLSSNFEQGDRIFLFGLSHGAYQAKTLTAMIAVVGLCALGNEEHIRVAHEIYLESECNPGRARAFKAHVSMDAKVHFLGLWDTASPVSAWEKRPGTTRVHENVCYIRHALALDESLNFQPEYVCGHQSAPDKYLFGDRSGIPPVREVFFAGTHSEIGGSTEAKGLSKSVLWMGDQAMVAGLSLKTSKVDWTDECSFRGVPGGPKKWYNRLLGVLPFTCPTYRAQEAATRWSMYRNEGRASLQGSGTGIDWNEIIGIDIGHEETERTRQNMNGRFEKDLFDLTSAPTIIKRCIPNPETTEWYRRLKVLGSIPGGISVILGLDAITSILCEMIQDKAEHAAEVLSILAEHDTENQLLLIPGLVERLNGARPENAEAAMTATKSYMGIIKVLFRKYGELPLPESYESGVSANGDADTTSQSSHLPAIASLLFARYIHLRNTDDMAKSKELLLSLPQSLFDTPEIQNCHATILEAEGTRDAMESAWRIRNALAQPNPGTYDRMLTHTTLNYATLLTQVQRGRGDDFFPNVMTRSQSSLLLQDREFAKCLVDLGNIFHNLDQTDGVIEVTKASIALFRRISHQTSAFDADLAIAFSNLSNKLHDEGRVEDAMEAIEESVRMRRILARQAARYQSDLAISLVNLSGLQLSLGDTERAHASAQEAVNLHRGGTFSHRSCHELASSLYALSCAQRSIGQIESALVTIQECVRIRQVFASAYPTVFIHGLSRALGDLSACLDGLGRYEEALVAIQRAVSIWDALAQDRPHIFNADLARSLSRLYVYLSNLGRHEDALVAITRAISLLEVLAQERPAVYTRDLAMVLNNFYVCLSNIGEHERALIAIQRTVSMYEVLAQNYPAVYNQDLAMSLNNLYSCFSNLGRHDEAIVAIQRAICIYEVLAHHRPVVFNQDLSMSLNNLCICLSDLGQHEEALVAITRAISLLEVLTQERPAVYTRDLAKVLNNFYVCLSNIGEHEGAFIAIQRAVAMYEVLAHDRPAVYNQDLATSLNNLYNALSRLDRHEEALIAIQRAVSMREVLVNVRPQVFNEDLAMSLHSLHNCLSNLGHHEEALLAIQRALSLFEPLAKERPAAFNQYLAAALYNLSLQYSNLERHVDALEAAKRSLDLYHELVKARPLVFKKDVIQGSHRLSRCREALNSNNEEANEIDKGSSSSSSSSTIFDRV